MSQNISNYLTVAELAKLLNISRVAVFNRIKKGQIPAEKLGKIYVIPKEFVDKIVQKVDVSVLTDEGKREISKAVDKTIKEYGETLRLLGKE